MKKAYKIEILGWEKHNKKSTKNMPSVMISKRFFDDPEIQTLPPSGKLLYLFLLLRRGDHDTTLFQCSHDDCVRFAGGRGVLVETLLDQLQSFQLLRYEKMPLNRIEKNRKESNRKENKGSKSASENFIEQTESQKTETEKKIIPTDQRSDPPHHKLLKIWNEFRGQLPFAKTLNPTRDRKMKAIWPKLVESEWIEVVKKLSESNFCTGKNDRGWIADFDFLLKPETFSRTLEGRYDNRQAMNHGMTEDGLYLTRGQKVSHNNKKLIEKYFKQGSENAEPGNGDADAIDC